MSATTAKRVLPTLIATLACACAPAGAAAAAQSAGAGGTAAAAPSGSHGRRASHRSKQHTPPPQLATWYGPGFYGRQTACGQTMTPTIVGVASRTLPCGTLVQITYAGHSATVPVIDRGPYGALGATWDLTAGAADALGIEETVRVATRIVGSAANTPTLGVPPGATAAEATGGSLAG